MVNFPPAGRGVKRQEPLIFEVQDSSVGATEAARGVGRKWKRSSFLDLSDLTRENETRSFFRCPNQMMSLCAKIGQALPFKSNFIFFQSFKSLQSVTLQRFGENLGGKFE